MESQARLSTSYGDTLSTQLRAETSRFLFNRRAILGCSLLASTCMGLVSLYQFGLIKHLPDPPLRGFHSDKVDAAPEAYRWLATPDGVLGLASYALTGVLSAMGGRHREERHPALPLLMALKTGGDTLAAAKLTYDQATKHKAFCLPCLVAAGSSFVSAAFSLPEARAALSRLWR